MAEPILIAADHAGFDLKEIIKEDLASKGYEVIDLGPDNAETSVDYPDYAYALGMDIAEGRAAKGILVCGSGVGMAIAANRIPEVRAAVLHEPVSARLSRSHNNANVIALGARIIGTELAKACVKAFLITEFLGGRHQKRVEQLGGCQA